MAAGAFGLARHPSIASRQGKPQPVGLALRAACQLAAALDGRVAAPRPYCDSKGPTVASRPKQRPRRGPKRWEPPFSTTLWSQSRPAMLAALPDPYGRLPRAAWYPRAPRSAAGASRSTGPPKRFCLLLPRSGGQKRLGAALPERRGLPGRRSRLRRRSAGSRPSAQLAKSAAALGSLLANCRLLFASGSAAPVCCGEAANTWIPKQRRQSARAALVAALLAVL